MNAARVRIGRITMKAGGAVIHLLPKAPNDILTAHLRAWTVDVLGKSRPPDAYAAVAFWFDPETPGRPGFNVSFCTTCDAIPAPLLGRIAAEYIAQDSAAHLGMCRAVEAMGGEVEDWEPDNAG